MIRIWSQDITKCWANSPSALSAVRPLPAPDDVGQDADQPGQDEEAAGQEEWRRVAAGGLIHQTSQWRSHHGRQAPEHGQQPEGAGELLQTQHVHEDDGGESDEGGNTESEH